MTETIVDRLGGRDGLSNAVYALYERLLGDDTTAAYFDDVDLPAVRVHMTDFLVAALTGQADGYRGRSLDVAHRGLAVTDAAFDSTVGHLGAVLSRAGASDAEVADAVAQLAPLRALVVSVD